MLYITHMKWENKKRLLAVLNKFFVTTISDEYNHSDNYTLEKKYDYTRYFIRYHGIIDEFREGYKSQLEEFDNYLSSDLHYVKNIIKEESLTDIEKDYFDKNSLNVEVVIQKKDKTGKVKKEKIKKYLKISDDLVEYFSTKNYLINLFKKLDNYKTVRDRGKHTFILEVGANYKNDKERNNVKLLIETTRNAVILLKRKPEEKLKVSAWKNFLESNLKLTRSYCTEYSYDACELHSIPQFEKSKIDIINNLNNYFIGKLENKNKDNIK